MLKRIKAWWQKKSPRVRVITHSTTNKRPEKWTRSGVCPSCLVEKGRRHRATCKVEYVYKPLK